MSRIKEIAVQNDKVSLSGTLALSATKQKSVAVLMLHGSGPLDRNANMTGQRLDIFNTIAASLDRSGISSYRYDKRGCGDSRGDYHSASFTDLIKDACAAVDMLASIPDIDGIVVLGHSEGTMIAPVVAHLKAEVIGLVLLCPTIQPVEETLMRQAEHIAEMVDAMPGVRGAVNRLLARMTGGILKRQRKFIDRIKASGKYTFGVQKQTVPAKMLKELLKHDPKSWIAKTRVPVIAISGAKDIQCLPSDADLIKELAQGPVESHCLNDLTHILRTDIAPPSFERYNELMKKDLEPRVVQLCIDWIVQQDSIHL